MTLINYKPKIIKLTSVLLGALSLFFLNSGTAGAAASYQVVSFGVDKAQATLGETVTYSLTVKNDGDVASTNFNVYQTTRPNFTTYANGSSVVIVDGVNYPIADAWYSSATGTNLGGLNAGQSMVFKWAVTVNADAPQTTTLTDAINIKTAEIQNPRGYQVSFVVAINQSRNSLCATKTADKTTANVGETITFTVRVCNDGDVKQTNIELYDRLHKEFTYKAGTTRATVRGVTSTVTDAWIGTETVNGLGVQINELNSGEEAVITFQVTLNSQATNNQVIQNAVQYKSIQLPNWQQCAVTVTAIVAPPPPVLGRIVAKKIVDPSSDTTKFSFSGDLSGNIGHNETLSKDVVAGTYFTTESVASGFELTSITCDDSDSTIDLGNKKATFKVAASETVTCTFTNRKISVPTGAPACSLTKKIRLPNGNEVTSVDGATHVYVPGESVIYRLFLSNPGSADGTSFKVIDTLPTYVFWTSGDGSYDSGANKVTFDLGTLKGGESRTLTYTAKVRDQIPAGSVTQTNSANVTYNGGACSSSSSLVIGKPGQVLAASVLPQTGAFSPSVIGTFFMVAGGLVVRLRKVKKYKYWNQ